MFNLLKKYLYHSPPILILKIWSFHLPIVFLHTQLAA